MKQHYDRQTMMLETDEQHIAYRLYRNKYCAEHSHAHRRHPGSRRLLLLHGAGVAGQDTWEHLLAYLSHWAEILVPDLRGMGDTRYPDAVERPYGADAVVDDLCALLDHLGWRQFDLGGYSFGGLVSMLLKARRPACVDKQYLLESALLDRASLDEVIRLREKYTEAAEAMREGADPQTGIRTFLDTISPNRVTSPRSEAMTIARLAQRPLGFSYALDAVSWAARELDRDALLAEQANVSSFIGGRSVEAMHRYQEGLSRQRADWLYHSIRGTDHSLPYQKPRQIARQMNADLEAYLGLTS